MVEHGGPTDDDGPGPRPATRRAEATQAKILKTAATLIRTEGISATSIERVAQDANIVRSTLYNYYPTRQRLLIDVARVEATRIVSRLSGRVKRNQQASEVVVEAALALVSAARRDRFLRLLLTDDENVSGNGDPADAVVRELMGRYWSPILTELDSEGALRGDPIRTLEWLSFVHYVLVTRPPTHPGGTQFARHLLERYVVPGVLKQREVAKR